MTGVLERWTSLRRSIALAEELPEHGAADVERWLAAQEARVGDPAFAEAFGDLHERFGVAPLDLTHRVVGSSGLRLLAGIRFFGHDPARPFVELLAWGGPPCPDWSAIRALIHHEWASFRPRAVRVFHPPGLTMPHDAEVDMTVHAAPYRSMAGLPWPPGATIAPMTDAVAAAHLVAERFRELAEDDPALSRDIHPIEEAALRDRISEGRVLGIALDGSLSGLLATRPGSVEWLRGEVIEEEVVMREASGRGLAAAAQAELARRRRIEAPRTLLLGTILGANVASRRTALRAGRPEIARYSFLPLTGRP